MCLSETRANHRRQPRIVALCAAGVPMLGSPPPVGCHFLGDLSMTVHLVRQRRRLKSKTAGGKPKIAVYYLLQWHNGGTTPSGKPKLQTQSLGRVTKARAEELRREKLAEIAGVAAPGSIRRGPAMTLGRFALLYLEARKLPEQASSARHKHYPRLKPTTLLEHDIAVRYLIEHLGEGRTLDTIGETEVDSFLDHLASGGLIRARKAGSRAYGLGEQTVRKHTRSLRAIWAWAQHRGMVASNPFREFHSRPLPTEPGHDVTLAELNALLTASPSREWRCMFALCRLAGLRREEARTLPWSGRVRDHRGDFRQVGIDWDTKRLHIVSTKKDRYRVVPMVPQLEAILLDAFGEADAGEMSITGLSPHNLTRQAQAIAATASLEPWPKVLPGDAGEPGERLEAGRVRRGHVHEVARPLRDRQSSALRESDGRRVRRGGEEVTWRLKLTSTSTSNLVIT